MQPAKFMIALLCMLAVLDAHAQMRDGNYWRGLPKEWQAVYVVGFLDGMDLGHHFSYWGCATGQDLSCSGASKSYASMSEKYFNRVKVGQLVDGLTDFYGNYRNRTIPIDKAIWIIVNEISGMPRNKVEELTENWRKATR